MCGEPDVSVCVTTYNHVRYIRRCMESVLAQVYPGAIELLVGDDGSNDGTRELVADIAARDRRVRVFFHSRNLGPSANLESLVMHARGRFIAHLDGDDTWAESKLARQCALLEADPRLAAAYSNAQVVSEGDQPLGMFNRGVPKRFGLPQLLRRGNFLNHSSLLYRASARQAVLGMSPDWIDYRLHVRLAAFGDLAYMDEPLVVHRWRTSGSMIRTMSRAVIDGQVDAYRDALLAGASPAAVRAASGHAWGKALVSGLLAWNLREVHLFSTRLRSLASLRTGWDWYFWQAILAPLRALRSRAARRAGIFFPWE